MSWNIYIIKINFEGNIMHIFHEHMNKILQM